MIQKLESALNSRRRDMLELMSDVSYYKEKWTEELENSRKLEEELKKTRELAKKLERQVVQANTAISSYLYQLI